MKLLTLGLKLNQVGSDSAAAGDFAASGEWINFTAFSNDASNGGTGVWGTPDRVETLDAGISITNISNSATQYLKCLGLAKKIPAGATVNGVQVRVSKYASLGIIVDDAISLVQLGAIAGGASNNKADTITNWPPTSTYFEYGTPSDKWGQTPTAADINDDTSGVVVSASSAGFTLPALSHIQMSITYT